MIQSCNYLTMYYEICSRARPLKVITCICKITRTCMMHRDVENCQTEGFDWQNFIQTDKILIFLLHILFFRRKRFSKSVQMTGMSEKISTSSSSSSSLFTLSHTTHHYLCACRVDWHYTPSIQCYRKHVHVYDQTSPLGNPHMTWKSCMLWQVSLPPLNIQWYILIYCIQLWIRPVLFSPYEDLTLICQVLHLPTPKFSYITLYH